MRLTVLSLYATDCGDQSVDVEGQPGLQDLFYVWLFYFMCVDMYSLQIPLALLPLPVLSVCSLCIIYGDLSHSSTPPPAPLLDSSISFPSF